MGNKGGKLTKNIILFAISSFGTKILAFLLVPFYTSYLSTAEYGTIDLITTTASLVLPIFTLNIFEAVMRFTIEDISNGNYFKIGVCITGLGFAFLTILGVIVAFIAPEMFTLEYIIWIIALHICNAFYSLFTNYLRATNNVNIIVIASIINSGLLMSLNIIFIAILRIGITGYFLSTVLALLVSTGFMFLQFRKTSKRNQVRTDSGIDKKTCKEMLLYSIPLIFTTIAWWINSGLDKYFVTLICGVAANGIYSIAYKIPTLLSVFQSVFSQAWSISAVTEYDENDSDGFFGRTYDIYGSLMILCCMGIMLFNRLLSHFLYANEFYIAWKYVPYLLIASLFSALAGYVGGIFSAVKKPAVMAWSTIVSAIINIFLNILLIPRFEIAGAAIATMAAYFASWLVRIIVSRKYIKMKSDYKKMIVSIVLLFVQMICAAGENQFYLVQVLIIIIVICLYQKNITFLLAYIYRGLGVKNGK